MNAGSTGCEGEIYEAINAAGSRVIIDLVKFGKGTGVTPGGFAAHDPTSCRNRYEIRTTPETEAEPPPLIPLQTQS